MHTSRFAVIGNGLFARTAAGPSLLELYARKQAKCPHAKRDPRGNCYSCGQKEPK
jgi:hypothetical protein